MALIVSGKLIATDQEGYLLNLSDWNESVAQAIAAQEPLELTPNHWEVIRFMRNFYQQYQTTPAMRVLVKAIAAALGEEKGNSIYLHRLFPKGFAKQVTKIAGLPKPVRCI